jgi:hypothetical protein
MKVHYRFHKNPSLVPILIQINPFDTSPFYLSKIAFTIIHPYLTDGFFPFGLPTNILYAFRFSPIRATCPAHLVLLDLIILIVLVKSTSYEAPHEVSPTSYFGS